MREDQHRETQRWPSFMLVLAKKHSHLRGGAKRKACMQKDEFGEPKLRTRKQKGKRTSSYIPLTAATPLPPPMPLPSSQSVECAKRHKNWVAVRAASPPRGTEEERRKGRRFRAKSSASHDAVKQQREPDALDRGDQGPGDGRIRWRAQIDGTEDEEGVWSFSETRSLPLLASGV